MKQNQSIKGNHNTQVAGDFTKYEIHIHNPVFNIVNSYSDIKTFEKVLFSIPFDRFSDEVIKPYLKNLLPGITESALKELTFNMMTDE